MNIWLIGGGFYGVSMLFAFALCKVASPAISEPEVATRSPVAP